MPSKYVFFYASIAVLLLTGCKQKGPTIPEDVSRATKKKMIEVNRTLVRKDQQRIKGYLERNELVMEETETGLWYRIDVEGNDRPVTPGKVVRIAYHIHLMDGTECYNSERNGIKEFLVGKGGVESGLEEGILLLHEGSKASFIMPPHLAHGLTGDGDCIPARAIILYDVEVLSVN